MTLADIVGCGEDQKSAAAAFTQCRRGGTAGAELYLAVVQFNCVRYI